MSDGGLVKGRGGVGSQESECSAKVALRGMTVSFSRWQCFGVAGKADVTTKVTARRSLNGCVREGKVWERLGTW